MFVNILLSNLETGSEADFNLLWQNILAYKGQNNTHEKLNIFGQVACDMHYTLYIYSLSFN